MPHIMRHIGIIIIGWLLNEAVDILKTQVLRGAAH